MYIYEYPTKESILSVYKWISGPPPFVTTPKSINPFLSFLLLLINVTKNFFTPVFLLQPFCYSPVFLWLCLQYLCICDCKSVENI